MLVRTSEVSIQMWVIYHIYPKSSRKIILVLQVMCLELSWWNADILPPEDSPPGQENDVAYLRPRGLKTAYVRCGNWGVSPFVKEKNMVWNHSFTMFHPSLVQTSGVSIIGNGQKKLPDWGRLLRPGSIRTWTTKQAWPMGPGRAIEDQVKSMNRLYSEKVTPKSPKK